ncbi:PepSY domain-containing protein [Ponticoccus sp. SC2-23]|uniref:PepSY domain-containing protein n=1 Tax=Alexandriicola marinus TaxID=2081710 RepID=UPI00193B23B9|nr:PepSY domain-containing protein [Alexandriicola marinus]MBM1222246.1 PepSY domain-containing protein [Ponticoccus sp. SC6-9]MBM1226933.1 PepSY domain-containing protein [Ponticoccus sp. SC6-15]MBM1231193.1 PepSY domain-containing protein [Ponticoccus sp. SC6-38]MBM1235555.1 PepSY domain-containing protein [Ponticoccus sp. SC6-45]MBM1240215.1 PepSY domain-containing protein [Ponticoccus sp. SC6-49]MBM1244569.1 PepSY domain-containing protein [Ponticoccus sp. SC2-64]MBM1249029.1 PepSY domai
MRSETTAMSKRSLKLAVALALGLFPGASFAQTAEESIISQLSQQGFTNISVSRTLLGRTRIQATSSSLRREIVFDPTTGVILRDYWRDLDDDDDDGNRLINPRSSSGGTGTAPSPSSPNDDDDDNDDAGSSPAPASNDDNDDDDDDDRRDDDDDRDNDRDDDDDGDDRDDRDDDDDDD